MNATIHLSDFENATPLGPWQRDLRAAGSTDVAHTQALTGEGNIWQAAVLRKFRRLLSLRAGWDGYGGKPIRREVMEFAWRVLVDCMNDASVAPQLVPLSDGTLQIEWHTRSVHIEVRVAAPYRVQVSYERGTYESDFHLVANFNDLQRLIPST